MLPLINCPPPMSPPSPFDVQSSLDSNPNSTPIPDIIPPPTESDSQKDVSQTKLDSDSEMTDSAALMNDSDSDEEIIEESYPRCSSYHSSTSQQKATTTRHSKQSIFSKVFAGKKSPAPLANRSIAVQQEPNYTYTSMFNELKIKNLVLNPEELYLPRSCDIQFIQYEEFHEINLPIVITAGCISQCFQDPPTSYDGKAVITGVVDPMFAALQKESHHHQIDPRMVGSSYINNYAGNNDYAQINCDAFWVGYFPASMCSLSIVADGCGPGQHSREAAQRTVAATRKHLLKHLRHEQNLEEFIQVGLDSLLIAHRKLVSDRKNSRTTTLNITFTFTAAGGEKYLLVFGLGDTKCYLYSKLAEGKSEVLDLSQYTRDFFSVTNSYGALGGFFDHCRRCRDFTLPYLRSLSVVCCRLPADRDFYPFNFTDGVYDNICPERLRKQPGDCHPVLAAWDPLLNWRDLKPSLRHKIRTKEATELFARLLSGFSFSEEENLNVVCEKITQYCREITAPVRTARESGDTTTSNDNFPGKMDHTAIVVTKVSRSSTIFASAVGEPSSSTTSGFFSLPVPGSSTDR